MFSHKTLQLHNIRKTACLILTRNLLRPTRKGNPSRRKWSKSRKVMLVSGLVGGASVTSSLMMSTTTLGPIYTFQDTADYDLPQDYNIPVIENYFRQRPLEVARRTGEIMVEAVPYLSRLLIWEYLIRRKIRDHEGLQRRYAMELREILTRLGPCFIKLGQAISIRPDLLPSSFLFELQKLCDSVPSFPTPEAVKMIEEELGRPVEEVFVGLNSGLEPKAAASLGQVYKVRLREEDVEVAVKVQRPDMLEAVLKDVYIIRNIAKAVDWIKSVITVHRPFNVAILDKFASANIKELDYLNEAKNQNKFRDELVPRLDNRVYIPAVYSKYTTRKVLVTEWVEGKQLAKSSPEVIAKLTPVGIECFLLQLLEIGYFHSDPHPGNLLVTRDGKLALIDFGLCAEVPLRDTTTMTLTIVHIMQGDVQGLVEDAVNLNFLPPDVDRETLIPVLQKVFDKAQLSVKKTVQQQTDFKAIQRRRNYFWAVAFDLNQIFYTYPFLVPDYFALITRAMIVLEGIAVTGDPDFDLFQAAYPFSLRKAVQMFGYSGLAQIGKEAASMMVQMGANPEDIADIDLLKTIK